MEMAENGALGDERDLVDAPDVAGRRRTSSSSRDTPIDDEKGDDRPMKAEAWIFAICTVFFLLVAPAYWFITEDPTGHVRAGR